jgi:hypothetical protein
MKNYFLQSDVPDEIVTYVDPSNNPVTNPPVFTALSEEIVPLDLPYFMILHKRAETDPDFDPHNGFDDVTSPIRESLHKLDMSTFNGDKKKMLAELHFLYVIGLAVFRAPNTYYVHQKAFDLFYKPGAFFPTFDPNALLDVKQRALEPVFDHMYEYVLPGRWWRALYGSIGLSPAVESAVALDREMREIEIVLEKPMR